MKIKTALLFLFIAPSVQAITEEEFRNGYRVFIEETARSVAESRRHEAKKEKYLELQADILTKMTRLELLRNIKQSIKLMPERYMILKLKTL